MSELLRKVQLTELDILKDLDRVCKANGITYYIAQGTLLGAAKYKGFIPWDDDVDVIIPYKDLVKLLEVYPEEGKDEYMITNHNIEKHFPLPWTKIRAKNTLSRPKRYQDLPINWGICIDIFPIFPASNHALMRKTESVLMKIAYKLLMAELTKYEDSRGFITRLAELTPIKFRHWYYNTLIKHLDKHKDSKYVWLTCKGKRIIDRNMIFSEPTELSFEDAVFPVPSRYHEYLTEFYGDYMAPLPEAEQRGHDLTMGDIEWKL